MKLPKARKKPLVTAKERRARKWARIQNSLFFTFAAILFILLGLYMITAVQIQLNRRHIIEHGDKDTCEYYRNHK